MTNVSANHGIKKLSDWSHVRKKSEMYYGSRNLHTQEIVTYRDFKPVVMETSWVPAVFTAFREIIDNALDEVVGHGFGSRIDITYDVKTREMSVEDDGRGIPTDWSEEEKCHLATMVMSECRTGRNFDERGEIAGTNGIGASGVNFCSKYFILDVVHNGVKFHQEFREGDEIFGESLQIVAPVIKKVKSAKSGTKITFKLSDSVFHNLTLPDEFIRSRATEIAICNPTLKIFYNGEQIKVKPKPEQTLFPDIKPIFIEIVEENFRSRFWITHGNDTPEHIHSIVNNIPTFNGGVHTETFRKFFYTGLLAGLESQSKRRKLTPNRSDVCDGIFVYSITNMMAPNFDSQSKTRLINEEVGMIIRKHLENGDLYKDLIKRNSEWIESIYERCAERTLKKDAADLNKLNKKSKKQKVEKLNDAIGLDRSKCILFIAEGDSAIGGLTEARNPQIHGGLPLRGKVLNVHPSKTTMKEAASNEALSQLMISIGLSIGERANRHKLRYGKIYITVDQDEDGKSILALLVNFFYQFWPELFDPKNPFIYAFDTPLIIAYKGKIRKYWYNDNYDEFDPLQYKGWDVIRAKGLSALSKIDWKNSLDAPRSQVITDDGELKEALDLIFNEKRADARKTWMGI